MAVSSIRKKGVKEMKKLISCLSLIILALSMSVVGQDKADQKQDKAVKKQDKAEKKNGKMKSGNVEQEVTKLVQDSMEAEKRHDTTFFEKLEAPDYQFIDPGGMVHTKEESLAISKSGDLKFESNNVDEMKVRVYGHTAVVNGQSTVKGTFKDHDISGKYRWTDVYVKRDGNWQLVNSQLTMVQPEMKPEMKP
jgi:ketosteroid isomerase-like protein